MWWLVERCYKYLYDIRYFLFDDMKMKDGNFIIISFICFKNFNIGDVWEVDLKDYDL